MSGRYQFLKTFRSDLQDAGNLTILSGYFSARAMAAWRPFGLKDFTESGGEIDLYVDQNSLTGEDDLQALRGISTDSDRDWVARKVRHGIIRPRIVEKKSGLFHHKVYYFANGKDEWLYSGGINLTSQGVADNSDSLTRSTDTTLLTTRNPNGIKAAQFIANLPDREDLVLKEPTEVRAEECEFKSEYRHEPETSTTVETDDAESKEFELRRYQRKAVQRFFDNDRRGIVKWAPGTGKTYLGAGIVQAFRKHFPTTTTNNMVTVVAPNTTIIGQWRECFESIGFDNVMFCDTRTDGWGDLQRLHEFLDPDFDTWQRKKRLGLLLTTFQQLLEWDGPFVPEAQQAGSIEHLLIGDEVHTLAGDRTYDLLSSSRLSNEACLGLSASPEHTYSHKKNRRIHSIFGDIIDDEYSLERKAFQVEDENGTKALTPVRYQLHHVQLTDEEAAAYGELSAEIGQIYNSHEEVVTGGSDRQDLSPKEKRALKRYNKLARERSWLLGNADNKIATFERTINNDPPEQHSIVFCSPHSVYTNEPYGERPKGKAQTKQLQMMAKNAGPGVRPTPIHGNLSRSEKQERIEDYRREEAAGNMLISVDCLSEGVDLPRAHVGYILSSFMDHKKRIQQIGRFVRPHPSFDGPATVHDFIAVPPPAADADAAVRQEIRRVEKILPIIENEQSIRSELKKLKEDYQE